MHKRVLKEEVVAQRQRLGDADGKLALKSQALRNLGDFFRKQTEGLGLQPNERDGGSKDESNNKMDALSDEKSIMKEEGTNVVD